MPTTYLPEVECVVAHAESFAGSSVVYVVDENGARHYLRTGRKEPGSSGSPAYLGVFVAALDEAGGRVLVELPAEADSGTRRVWVPVARLKRAPTGVADAS